jgi:hypothetical protein
VTGVQTCALPIYNYLVEIAHKSFYLQLNIIKYQYTTLLVLNYDT